MGAPPPRPDVLMFDEEVVTAERGRPRVALPGG
jgi:hypothetical protein